MAEQSIAQSRQFGNPVFREIHKNTWLKRLPPESKKKKERVWVVFCIHDDTDAFLEIYLDNKTAVLHKPEWFFCLNNTQHVSPTICAQEQDYEFVITLSNEVVRLAAPSWEAMLDWVESLRGKLYELKILTPKENLYSKLPETRSIPLLSTRDPTSPLPLPPSLNNTVPRDPTSPLPPPPAVPPALLPGIEPIAERSLTPNLTRRHTALQRGLSLPETSMRSESANNITIVHVEVSQPNVFNYENISNVLQSQSSSTAEASNSYERLFQLQQSPGPSNRASRSQRPPAANSGRLVAVPEPLTLREHQVKQLQKEMKHPGGVRLLLRKNCISSIALVDANTSVWVCGWKQKENPMLYNALHIGDQLLTIEGITVKSSNDAHKILRSISSIYVHIVIKRVPHGQVFVIHRDVEGQPLGIIQEGNTAVIANVEGGSLVARQGLSTHAQTCDGQSFTNWVLTEINGRPLNLFFKESQVKDRLNAVGRDISILVQPLDLIKQLKKQLKSLKNYKDYILQ
ncbi:PREDICTED: uncharacterized protein LOC108563633 [Nicrophorus vespilloides]|uniref:Uncharacterized protein LOC108563633 n=1 Tax=Nicrophorus vespilloides TaxID=110193 RepID=A0ABM1MTF9_NICVS|nr:PREDICTED: uncharacterized protein LOC108563633 [Nicrophorus vespilloides]